MTPRLSLCRVAARLSVPVLGLGLASGAAQSAFVTSYVGIDGGGNARRSHVSWAGVVDDYVSDGYGYSGSTGGSTDIGGTTSTSLASASYDKPEFGGPHHAAGVATADLATASLQVAASTYTNQTNVPTVADAQARWADDLHFTTQGAAADTVRQVVLDFHLTGSSSGGLVYPYEVDYTSILFQVLVGRTSGPGASSGGGSFQWLADNHNAGFKSGVSFDHYQLLSTSLSDLHLQATLDLVGPQTSYNIDIQLFLRCQNGASCAYGDPGQFSLLLPADVSFSSDSGVLLSAVPEPQTWALWLAGLGALGSLARRRHAAQLRP